MVTYFSYKRPLVVLGFVSISLLLMALSPNASAVKKEDVQINLASLCIESSKRMPGRYDKESLNQACQKVVALPGCQSEKGVPIFHYENEVSKTKKKNPKNILVISLIHGDELDSGSISRRWMSRLETINSRNRWRIIPVANPDGWAKKTRVNARGVDINRNFPSKDWQSLAIKLWETKKNRDPRRNPGPKAASESETRCLLKHLDDFKPDFVIAIHTPYGVLDYDGPDVALPRFKDIPWVRLGTFPGSLGRYMWVDKDVPVLTVELKNSQIVNMMRKIDRLQDISGTVAIRTKKAQLEKRAQKTK